MPRTLYVTNVNPEVVRAELEGLFAAHGTIRSVAVLKFQTADGASTAFVEMDSEAHGEAAIAALNGVSHRGAALAVRWAIPGRR
jgi:RNA recognition motif-containing protein